MTPTATGPARAPVVLASLVLVAAVANLNLAVANVALPDIGRDLDTGQTGLNLIAVGYSLGLAASVLWLGALGDRHGRKRMLLLGTGLAIPTSIAAALSGSVEALVLARLAGGLAAGMAFPTTLALITALWSGPPRTRAIALWSGLGGAISAFGPLLAGALLTGFEWGSVFLVTLPLAVVALVMAARFVPAGVNEGSDPVDNLGGVLSVLLVAALVLAINFAIVPGKGVFAASLAGVAIAAALAFVLRQRRTRFPLYDLKVAARRTFWVAAVAGTIVFGTLMGAMYVGQQFMQNVLGYSTVSSGAAILPAAALLVLVAPRSAKLVHARGARFTLILGFLVCLLGFVAMLLLWTEDIAYWKVGLAYALVGAGVGLAGTPASQSLTTSVPVRRAGMASGTSDLQRDLGGAVMQSLLGAVLAAGYVKAFNAAIAASPQGNQVTDGVQAELQRSFASAEDVAERYPKYESDILEAARSSFLSGDRWAYVAGIVAVLIGAALVWLRFPGREQEHRLQAGYAEQDAANEPGHDRVANTVP